MGETIGAGSYDVCSGGSGEVSPMGESPWSEYGYDGGYSSEMSG